MPSTESVLDALREVIEDPKTKPQMKVAACQLIVRLAARMDAKPRPAKP